MLGYSIADPDGLEGTPRTVKGLGHLPVDTRLTSIKQLREVRGKTLGASFTGYEMHMGVSDRQAGLQPFATLQDATNDGAISASGRILGTYVHGIFQSHGFRESVLKMLGSESGAQDQQSVIDTALDRISQQLEDQMDMEKLLNIANIAGLNA